MDKLGPIARSVEDCALILDAIHGRDGLDPTAVDHPFAWPPRLALHGLRVGYLDKKDQPCDKRDDLKVLRDLGVTLIPIELPDQYPTGAVTLMLRTEAAAAFDELTRGHVTEGLNNWPHAFLQGQFTPAVEYLRAARVRSLLMRAMGRLLETVDLYVGSGEDLEITNLTGHPTVVLPDAFVPLNGRDAPGSLTFTGRLYQESTLLAVANAYQQATGYHLRRPPLEQFLAEEAAGVKAQT